MMFPSQQAAMPTPHHSPFTITPRQLTLVGEICERIGRWGGRDLALSPQLRKANRIQSIQADQVRLLLASFGSEAELSSDELLRRLGLRHKPTFRKNYLNPALALGVIAMTEPASPRSPTQRYRLTGVVRPF
jgi:hypothetical protein